MKKVLILVAAIVLVSCSKDEQVEECRTVDLGKAGETYTPYDTNGAVGVIYVDGDRIKQDICS